jgi:hypothetical protein
MRPVAIVVGLALALSLSGAALADTLRYVVIANGEKVGHLTAEVQGRVTTVDYAISNNGRGPKARERIEADASGMPVSWVVDGESLFGSPVSERFNWPSLLDQPGRQGRRRHATAAALHRQ